MTSNNVMNDMLKLWLIVLFVSIHVISGDYRITDIDVLDNYFDDATKFMSDRPIVNGIALVLPKRSPNRLIPVSHRERPADRPTFHSKIVSQNREKQLQEYPKSKFKNNLSEQYVKNGPKDSRHYYPKSINERLKQYALENDESDDQIDGQTDDQTDDIPKFNKPVQFTNDFKSKKSNNNYKPSFGRQRESPNKATNNNNYNKHLPNVQNTPKSYQMSNNRDIDLPKIKTTETPKKPLTLFDASPPHSLGNDLDFMKPNAHSNKMKSLAQDFPYQSFDKQWERPKTYRTATANQLSHKNSGRFSMSNEQPKHRKEMQKQPKKQDMLSEEKERHPKEEYREKQVKEKHRNERRKPVNDHPLDHHEDEKKVQYVEGEDLESNDDPDHYPHQYAIEIRWKNNGMLDGPEGDVGEREMHSSKDYEDAKYRLYKHEEEEHWHEKKWLNEGLKKAYADGHYLPVHIHQPRVKLSDDQYNPLPIYAQALPNGATLQEINQHFGVPTPNFRVNNRFMQWAKRGIHFNAQPNPIIAILG